MKTASPFTKEWEESCQAALAFLSAQTGFRLWLIAELSGGQCFISSVFDRCEARVPKATVPWSDMVCQHMVAGTGPPFAADIRAVPAYMDAPFLQRWPMRAYLGAPIIDVAGKLLGAVCGFDPEPQSELAARHLPTVEFVAKMLAALQASREQMVEIARQLERVETQALLDPLTGLFNRRGWDQLAAVEQNRSSRHGRSWSVFLIDLDGLKQVNDFQGHIAGDQLLQRAAKAIRDSLRHHDLAARIGGDEFVVLAVECDEQGALQIRQRLEQNLRQQNVHASIGHACGRPTDAIQQVVELADRAMLQCKSAKRNRP